ncbi:hypothetical protein [Actinoplanes sp. NPDC049265]|uniref:hypothetical protein n=1 Tax=Actinoplanes sp. NPDC049265 TaxID=3363902 RepID=UPI003710F855
MTVSRPAEVKPGRRGQRPSRADVVAAGVALGLFALTAVVGVVLWLAGRPVHAGAAPLFASWLPHVGPGTVPTVLIAVLVCAYGPGLAARLSWQQLSIVTWLAAVAWTTSLALVDGWSRGVSGRLTTEYEYLHEVPGVTDAGMMLREFTGRILDFQPGSWTTHVAGHPPGALLVFVGLDRVGLAGGGWAGVLCILVGALTAVAVPRTVRRLGTDQAARASIPFLVLFPGAVWIGVSADGLFAGVTATGVALLASGAVRGSAVRLLGAGVLLGFGCYLSYGLVLMAPVALAVLWLGRARLRQVAWAVGGAVAVAVAFTVAGFNWFTGYHLLIERYYQGVASVRPYAYWVAADLAIIFAVSAGPASAVILRRAVSHLAGRWQRASAGDRGVAAQARGEGATGRGTGATWRRAAQLAAAISPRPENQDVAAATRLSPATGTRLPSATGTRLVPDTAAWLLPVAAAVAILAADLSGYSKAEVERIWLPFAVWLPAGAVLIPDGSWRRWLVVQAVVAITVNHLLVTTW